jgi:hypothetical protein
MIHEMFSTHFTAVERGVIGVLSTSTGTIVSLFPAIEMWLRITSLAVGISVGIATLISILKKK